MGLNEDGVISLSFAFKRAIEKQFQVEQGEIGVWIMGQTDSKNILIYEANLNILLQEIDDSRDSNRSLRHAYNDLVSTFESYCKLVSEKHKLGIVNFQNLKNTKDHFKKQGLNIYESISDKEKTKIKRVFEKRHAYQHAKGKITTEYIKNIPEDSKLIDTIAELSKNEFVESVDILKKVFRNITNKYSS